MCVCVCACVCVCVCVVCTHMCMYVRIPHREMEKKKITLECEFKELNDSLKKVETKINTIMEEKEDVIKEVEGKRALLEIKEREYNQLVKLLELTRENEAASLTERLVIFMWFLLSSKFFFSLHSRIQT